MLSFFFIFFFSFFLFSFCVDVWGLWDFGGVAGIVVGGVWRVTYI